jgi:dipeptide/tripeptide permease
LELAFSAAPQSMKGFVTACWLAMVFLGNLLNVPIVPFYDKLLAPGPYFAALTGMLALVTLAFVFVARRFNRTAAESEGHAAPP